MEYRSIERSTKKRMQSIILVPGGFHILMAILDSIFWNFIKPKNLQIEGWSLYDLLVLMSPKDAAKITTNPSYHMMHDGIQNLACAQILTIVDNFTGGKGRDGLTTWLSGQSHQGQWSVVRMLAKEIMTHHLTTTTSLNDSNDGNNGSSQAKCDIACENRLLFNHNVVWYCAVDHAMKMGAVGAMEEILWIWVPIFLGCRKHKYSMHLAKFLCNLQDVYPP